MNLSLLLFHPDRFLDEISSDRIRLLPFALIVAAGASVSRTLADLLSTSASLFPSQQILFPAVLLRFLGSLASGLLWSAWLWFAVSFLRRSAPEESSGHAGIFVSLLVAAQAPHLFTAGLSLPLTLFAGQAAGPLRGLLIIGLGLWSLALQTAILRRVSGFPLASSIGLILGSALLLVFASLFILGSAAAGLAAKVGLS
jgi:hypothetical protein